MLAVTTSMQHHSLWQPWQSLTDEWPQVVVSAWSVHGQCKTIVTSIAGGTVAIYSAQQCSSSVQLVLLNRGQLTFWPPPNAHWDITSQQTFSNSLFGASSCFLQCVIHRLHINFHLNFEFESSFLPEKQATSSPSFLQQFIITFTTASILQ